MKKITFTVCAALAFSVTAAAKDVTVILKNSKILKGDMVGANDRVLFLNEKGTAREIARSEIKEVFDDKTSEPVGLSAGEAAPPGYSGGEKTDPGQEEGNPSVTTVEADGETRSSPPQGRETEPREYFEIFAYGSLDNSYAIGRPMQQWMASDIQSGSPAFANFGGNYFMGLDPENTLLLGFGVSVNMPPSHSIWGSSLYFGGRNELVLDPYTFSLDLPFRYEFSDSGLSITLAPSLLMAILSGKYSTTGSVNVNGSPLTGTFYTNLGSAGIGFGASLGAEYYLGMIGFGVKCGVRILQSALNFDSPAGPWSPADSQGNLLGIDLGGSYMAVGAMIKFGN